MSCRAEERLSIIRVTRPRGAESGGPPRRWGSGPATTRVIVWLAIRLGLRITPQLTALSYRLVQRLGWGVYASSLLVRRDIDRHRLSESLLCQNIDFQTPRYTAVYR